MKHLIKQLVNYFFITMPKIQKAIDQHLQD